LCSITSLLASWSPAQKKIQKTIQKATQKNPKNLQKPKNKLVMTSTHCRLGPFVSKPKKNQKKPKKKPKKTKKKTKKNQKKPKKTKKKTKKNQKKTKKKPKKNNGQSQDHLYQLSRNDQL
jgi:hypothetical protein